MITIYRIASRLNYLQLKDIIHRNLSLDNFYLDEYLYLKMFDLERISKLQDQHSESDISIYKAPEVIKNNLYHKSSDVYSFAIIWYEILNDEIKEDFDQQEIFGVS